MCNLYRMSKSQDEVARFFAAIAQDLAIAPSNTPEEIYPGYPGLVLAGNTLRSMTWGFPLARKGVKGQPIKPKPVNNARADKLSSPFWWASFRDRRCLVPVSAFAEARGPKGGKTRSWFSMPDAELFAVGGFWRPSAEWDEVFTMVMTDAAGPVTQLHDRMPVILGPGDWSEWLAGSADDAKAMCRPWSGELAVDHTEQPWTGLR